MSFIESFYSVHLFCYTSLFHATFVSLFELQLISVFCDVMQMCLFAVMLMFMHWNVKPSFTALLHSVRVHSASL